MARTNRMLINVENVVAETPARSSGILNNDDFVGLLSKRPMANAVEGQFAETPSTNVRSFTDDGSGALTGTGMTGEVNYETGQITLRASAGGQTVLDSSVALNFFGHDAAPNERMSTPTVSGSPPMTNGDCDSQIVECKRILDEQGIFQVMMPATVGASVVQLWGRADPAAPWFKIHEFAVGDMGVNDTAAVVVSVFPEMKAATPVIVGNPTAVASMSAWLVE